MESQARIEVRAYKQEDVRVATGAMAEPEDCRVRCNNPHKKTLVATVTLHSAVHASRMPHSMPHLTAHSSGPSVLTHA